MWRRLWVLAIVLVVHTCLLAWLATLIVYVIFEPVEGTREAMSFLFSPSQWEFDDLMWWVYIGWPTLLIVATQVLFLWPLRDVELRPRRDGKPLKKVIITAGFVGAVMMVALLFGVAGAAQLVWSLRTNEDPANIPLDDDAIPFVFLVVGVALLGSWIAWTILLRRFVQRHDPPTHSGRIVGLLFAGTAVEMLVLLPVDIMLRRRTDCYCGTGGFYSLILSAWALLWLCGPGAFLVLTRKKRRRAWARTHCPRCGYARGPSPTERCPECGHEWSPAGSSS